VRREGPEHLAYRGDSTRVRLYLGGYHPVQGAGHNSLTREKRRVKQDVNSSRAAVVTGSLPFDLPVIE